jgi:hypothetical protein
LVAKIHQTELITRKSYYTNYDVLADGIVVGRIMKAAAVPAGLSWMRTLALIALPALAWFEAHGEGAARQRTMVEAVSPPSPSSPVDVPSGSNGLAAMLV